MFRRLQTKLTVLYAGLFGAAMLLVSIAVYGAVAANAERMVRAELEAGGTVFDRLWSLRSEQMHEGAALLARDFGFRAALADGDAATIGSAVDNLKARLGVDRAFVIGVDGAPIAGSSQAAEPVAAALMADEEAAGVVLIQGEPYQAVSAQILSPSLAGWVVFASRLDQREMSALTRLSAIPLDAAVVHRQDGAWLSSASRSPRDAQAVSRFVAANLGRQGARKLEADGASLALVKPLKLMNADAPAVLMLRYPLAQALAPYRPLLAMILAVGLVGLALLAWGSWMLARTLTRPIAELDDAVRRLQAGEDVAVSVATHDEVGRLAESFNTMASAIRVRERQITQLATTDAETELPNRLALERAIAPMTAAGQTVVVAAVGIDRFDHIRGAIGYSLTGAFVGEVGRRLGRLRPDAVIARLSSDTLAVALAVSDLALVERGIAEIRAQLEQPVQLGDATVDLSVTCGLAAIEPGAEAGRPLLERASIALDQARAGGRKTLWFDEALYGDPAANLSLMSEMLQAIAAGQLCVHYQPKYDLRAGSVTALEALVRWPHPERGLLPPDLFVGMAEETGHIRALTEFVLGQALDDQRRLAAQGHVLAVSVNLSGRLVGDADFTERALSLAAGRAGDLCLEVTETAVMDNPQAALAQLDRFAKAGLAISIDDYGSGLSSLAYLKQIRADELKIDKAFVMGMAASQRDALLIRSTIDLAHGLGMKVVAEGVEEAAAAAMLAGMGCDFAQGYFIAKPKPIEDLVTFLDEGAARDADGAQGDALDQNNAAGARGREPRRAGARPA